MNKRKITYILFWSFVAVFFGMGTLGYLLAGETWYDATYYSAQLFFMNFSAGENDNLLIYISRVLCPIMTATGILSLLRNFFKSISDGVASSLNDATAVYYDTEEMRKYGSNFKSPVFMKDKVNKKAKSHVLMFERDMDNLSFYEKMKKYLKKSSKVYIKLDNIESKLLNKSAIHYFNLNEMIARKYWGDRNLQKYLAFGKMDIKIAILGFDALGKSILDYGLMNNIYSLEQSIQYHVWGDSCLHHNLLGEFDKMNGDAIIYHAKEWKEETEQLKSFDRIIVAQEVNVELLQTLLYLNSDAEIDFYNPEGLELRGILMGEKLLPFGSQKEIITEENIKTDKLYREAKELNYNYEVKYDKTGKYTWDCPDVEALMEEKWEELSGFLKGSNMAAVDYHKVRTIVMETLQMDKQKLSDEQKEMLMEMEHIRWSRYHYVNHWTYSAQRNNSKRQHPLLVPYDKLTREEQLKDWDTIEEMF